MLRELSLSALVAASVLTSVGCGPMVPQPRTSLKGSSDNSPLGPSYVLIPVPSDDDDLLGRVLPSLPEAGRSLEETARPNPCADKLAAAKTSPLANSFEDAQELSVGAKGKAMLGVFGFEGDASHATHFAYKIETQKRIARSDTNDYVACCKEKGCGYGYVSALIYGEGEYATGEEGKASGGVDVATFGGVSGSTKLKILHKRKVHGWIAAVVTVTDESKGERLGPLGVAAAAGITESSVSDTVKVLYHKEKISVEGTGDKYILRDGRGAAITENEFVRRFRRVASSDELDDVEVRRNLPSVIVLGSATGLSAAVAIYGFANLSVGCSPSNYVSGVDNDCSQITRTDVQHHSSSVYLRNGTTTSGGALALGIAGAVGTVGFGIPFLIAFFGGDGSAQSHAITDHDAVLYTERYNRALLRRTVREVQRSHEQSKIEPLLGPGFIGARGVF